jgi:TP901 family phage tail tape measure protein
MAKFATTANRMAKELSTTTNEFAKASLIYYQQGDSAELAAKKAEITLKATNAAFKATASEMSEMLTSTWNGYQAGADELERYVDIVANLGANTASSMEEIMTSLQKVAATANTVGVSMEQMSAMIATVSSTTRQSAEIVGTAMNTMLSRFASLKLGETLDDGVTLTKYTNALASIGVNVLDANGELRNMGNIINEIMEKWQTLSTSQKAALAQTVGSVRQYTNIMALFNNQDAYQKNMGLAQDSAGALQKMQDIRMEGWEGASKRLKASIEGIYQSLLNDQSFIAFTNSITKVIEQVQNLIQSFGGIQGIIQQVGAIAL